MSLVNIHLTATKALVAADTTSLSRATALGTDTYHHAAKIIPFAHTGMVIAGRGDLVLFSLLTTTIMLNAGTVDIDFMETHFLQLATAATTQRYQLLARQGIRQPPAYHDDGNTELFAVGWSQKHQQMKGWTCDVIGGIAGGLQEVESWCAGPHVWPTPHDVPPLSTPSSMAAAARAQVTAFKQQFPGAPIGGTLVVVELERDRMTISSNEGLD